MATLTLIVTDAGRAEIVNATNTGTLPVILNQIALGTGRWTPDTTATALLAEIKRVNTVAGTVVSPDTISVTITDDSTDAYSLGEFGLYTDTGVLFAIYSDSVNGVTDKAADALLLVVADTVFTSIAPGSITVSGTGFTNPPASETQAGVLEVATQVEADSGVDHTRAITPQTLTSILTQYLLSTTYNAADVLAKLLTVDGALSGLDSDLLDAQHGSYYRNASNLNAGILSALRFADSSHGDRSGGTLHALATAVLAGFMSPFHFNKLEGIEAAATADQTAAEILALLLTVDGTLSNLDADLLDGLHADFLRNASNLNAGSIPTARFSDVSHGARTGGTLHAVATTLAHGFMASTDKSLLLSIEAKINGIENNATADQTAAEILTLLKTVDGINSGVDTDLIHGKQAIINGFDLPSIRYKNIKLSTVTQDGFPTGMVLNSSETKAYIAGNASNTIYQYTLSEPGNISTAIFDNLEVYIAATANDPVDFKIADNDTLFYVLSGGVLYLYYTALPDDISTATYTNKSIDFTTYDLNPVAFAISKDGYHIYMLGEATSTIYHIELNVAFDITSTIFQTDQFNISAESASPTGLFLDADNSGFTLLDNSGQKHAIHYKMDIPTDITTAFYDGDQYYFNQLISSPDNIIYNNDGTKMYIIDTGQAKIFQYNSGFVSV